MPHRSAVPLTPERGVAPREDAVRCLDAGRPDHAVDIDALRPALGTEMAGGPFPPSS